MKKLLKIVVALTASFVMAVIIFFHFFGVIVIDGDSFSPVVNDNECWIFKKVDRASRGDYVIYKEFLNPKIRHLGLIMEKFGDGIVVLTDLEDATTRTVNKSTIVGVLTFRYYPL